MLLRHGLPERHKTVYFGTGKKYSSDELYLENSDFNIKIQPRFTCKTSTLRMSLKVIVSHKLSKNILSQVVYKISF